MQNQKLVVLIDAHLLTHYRNGHSGSECNRRGAEFALHMFKPFMEELISKLPRQYTGDRHFEFTVEVALKETL